MLRSQEVELHRTSIAGKFVSPLNKASRAGKDSPGRKFPRTEGSQKNVRLNLASAGCQVADLLGNAGPTSVQSCSTIAIKLRRSFPHPDHSTKNSFICMTWIGRNFEFHALKITLLLFLLHTCAYLKFCGPCKNSDLSINF